MLYLLKAKNHTQALSWRSNDWLSHEHNHVWMMTNVTFNSPTNEWIVSNRMLRSISTIEFWSPTDEPGPQIPTAGGTDSDDEEERKRNQWGIKHEEMRRTIQRACSAGKGRSFLRRCYEVALKLTGQIWDLVPPDTETSTKRRAFSSSGLQLPTLHYRNHATKKTHLLQREKEAKTTARWGRNRTNEKFTLVRQKTGNLCLASHAGIRCKPAVQNVTLQTNKILFLIVRTFNAGFYHNFSTRSN